MKTVQKHWSNLRSKPVGFQLDIWEGFLSSEDISLEYLAAKQPHHQAITWLCLTTIQEVRVLLLLFLCPFPDDNGTRLLHSNNPNVIASTVKNGRIGYIQIRDKKKLVSSIRLVLHVVSLNSANLRRGFQHQKLNSFNLLMFYIEVPCQVHCGANTSYDNLILGLFIIYAEFSKIWKDKRADF